MIYIVVREYQREIGKLPEFLFVGAFKEEKDAWSKVSEVTKAFPGDSCYVRGCPILDQNKRLF